MQDLSQMNQLFFKIILFSSDYRKGLNVFFVNCTLNIVTGKWNDSYLLDSRAVLGHFNVHSKLTGGIISLINVLLLCLNWKVTLMSHRNGMYIPSHQKSKRRNCHNKPQRTYKISGCLSLPYWFLKPMCLATLQLEAPEVKLPKLCWSSLNSSLFAVGVNFLVTKNFKPLKPINSHVI